MNATEATTNIIIALINNHIVSNSDDIKEAYKQIYKIVRYPNEDNNDD